MIPHLDTNTILCMSLAGRPGNFGTRFHNFLYKELRLNYIYKSFTTNNLEDALRGIRALGIRGCAVSMPYKEEVSKFLNKLDPSAVAVRAVNTIVNDKGQLTGFNTDFVAVRELFQTHKISSTLSVGLLGNGGMAKATLCALQNLGFRNGTVLSRNEEDGVKLAQKYGFEWSHHLSPKKFDVLINATPIGMALSTESPFTKEKVGAATYVIDAVANPPETELIKLARSLNKNVITGHQITIIQAREQFKLYTGVTPPQDLLEKAGEYALSV